VVLAASTLLGLDDEPGELTGFGPIPAQVARLLATDGVWRRLLTDPAGRLSDVSVDSYRPTQAMRDFVLARDSVCQGPGCRMPAERCDLDHTLEWPCGPTCPGNLCPLCRRDHRLKTLTDATVEPDGAGGLVWTLPSGRRYHRRAEPLLDHPGLTTEPVGAGLLDLDGGPPGGTDPPAPPPEDDVPPF
jgi:hypothetical protein